MGGWGHNRAGHNSEAVRYMTASLTHGACLTLAIRPPDVYNVTDENVTVLLVEGDPLDEYTPRGIGQVEQGATVRCSDTVAQVLGQSPFILKRVAKKLGCLPTCRSNQRVAISLTVNTVIINYPSRPTHDVHNHGYYKPIHG